MGLTAQPVISDHLDVKGKIFMTDVEQRNAALDQLHRIEQYLKEKLDKSLRYRIYPNGFYDYLPTLLIQNCKKNQAMVTVDVLEPNQFFVDLVDLPWQELGQIPFFELCVFIDKVFAGEKTRVYYA